jgi:uncharacterized secreted protein with C-terminal beta-propeller domain
MRREKNESADLPYIGDQVWLITSRQTDPLLFPPTTIPHRTKIMSASDLFGTSPVEFHRIPDPTLTYISSMFG